MTAHSKQIRLTISLMVFILLGFTRMQAQYYMQDNFANGNNWMMDLWYNVELGVWQPAYSTAGGRLQSWSITGNKMQMDGNYVNKFYYTSSFFGVYSLLTNVNLAASPENPVGIEITRWVMRNDNGGASWQGGAFDIGLVQYNAGILSQTEDSFFDSARLVSELDYQFQSTTSHIAWKQKSFTNSKMILTSVTNNAGLTADIESLIEWNHNGGINTHPLRYRFVHDGEYIYYYVNPSPNGVDGSYSNTFYLISRIAVPSDFTNNLSLLVGFGSLCDNASVGGDSPSRADMTNMVIRSIADSITTEISPSTIAAGGTADIHVVIKPDFSTHTADYAGVGEVYITLPDNYTNWDNYTNEMGFFWIDGGSIDTTFGQEPGDQNPVSGNVALSIIDGGQTLKVRFSGTTADGEVFHPDNLGGATDPAIMFVISNFSTHSTADSAGESFTVYAGNELYTDTDWAKYSTAGKMKSFTGDAFNMTQLAQVDEDTAVIRTVNDPVGIGAIRPGEVYEGDVSTYYYDLSIANGTNNNADVTRIDIIVPADFTIDANSFTSDRITSNEMYLTNISGSDVIVIDYAAGDTKLVAGSGIDTISFKSTTTPALSGTNLMSTTWQSVSSSSVSGTGIYTNVTSLVYPSQVVNIRKRPPDGEAYTLSAVFENIELSNTTTYVVKNNGFAGNYINKVLLEFDALLTNVTQVSSSFPAVVNQYVSNSSIWVELDYNASSAAITNGFLDTITFMLKAEVRPNTNEVISLDIQAYADNGNGEGYVALTENQNGWNARYYTPFAEVGGSILSPTEEGGDEGTTYFHHYYSDQTTTTNVTFKVQNRGKYYNDIYEVEIHAPLDVIGISAVNTSTGVARITNFGSTNAVVVSYTNSGLLTADTDQFGEEDTITLFFTENIVAPKNISFKLFAKNTTNKAQGANLTPDNLTLHYIYPPARAQGYVNVPGGFIDAATNAFTINYVITNTGRADNKINLVRINMPGQFTNSDFVSHTHGGIADDSGVDLLIDYTGVGGLAGGDADTITFIVYDNIGAGEFFLNMTSDVSNDRWYTNDIGIPGGRTQTIHITPPPTLYSYNTSPRVFYNGNAEVNTNTIALSVSNRGWGSNELDKVKIFVPSGLIGKVIAVSNVSTGLTNTANGDVSISNAGAYIWIEYDDAGSQLAAGSADTTYITFISDLSAPSDVQWLVEAANNSTNGDGSHNITNTGTMLDGGTNRLLLVDKAYGHVSAPNPPALATPTTFNTITYYIKNGDETTGAGIQKVRIALSNSLFSGVNNITTAAGSYTTNYFENGSSWVEVWYSGAGLGPKSSDNISFTAFDTNTTQEVWVTLPFEADYGDGGGWHGNTGITPTKTNAVEFQRPSVSALSYVDPIEVPKAFPSQSYNFYLKNNGIVGSDLLRLKIIAPDFITNLTGLTSPITASNYVTTNSVNGLSNVAIFIYTNSIVSGDTDSITLLAYDAVNSETNGTWQVLVNNDYGENGETAAVVPAGQSLGLDIITPPVDARIKIQATNYISAAKKNSINATEITNYLKFDIFNFSGGGDFVTYARILVPEIDTVLDTNTISVSSLIKTDMAWSLSNGYIVIDYQDTNWIGAGFKDELIISIVDRINYTNLTVAWSADVAFDTTYNQFTTASLYSGGSLNINYEMPDPLASIIMSPSEVYLDRASFGFNYRVVNTGTGDNDIDRVFITLPTELQSGFSISGVSNTFANATNYSAGVLTLEYTNFGTGQTDDLWLYVNNTTAVSANIDITAEVRNQVNTNAASGNQTMFMATVPSYYMTPNAVDTTTTNNTFQVFVNNDSTGSGYIQRVVLSFPSEFAAIDSIKSTFFTLAATNIVGTSSSVTLYYEPGNYIGQLTNKDVITVSLFDGVGIGDVTNSLSGWVDDGMGLLPLKLKSGKSLNVSFNMPPAEADISLDPQYIYLGTLTNTLNIDLQNTGTGSSGITYAKIRLPLGLSNAHNLNSTQGGSVINYHAASNVIILDYTAGILNPTQTDNISFDIVNYYGASTNVTIEVDIANLTNNQVYNLASGPLGDYLISSISYPPIAVETYFPGDNKLYTIETNASLTYRILNRSFGKTLTKVEMHFLTNTQFTNGLTNYFTSVTAESSIPGAVVSVDMPNNKITVDYATNTIDDMNYTLFDDLSITFSYSLTNLFGFQITNQAWLVNENLNPSTVTNVETVGVTGFKGFVQLTNSTWGMVYGQVYPDLKGVNIKVYYPDTSATATNISGEFVATSTSPANPDFLLTRLPAGNYDVEFSGTGYRKFIETVTIPANMISNISIITMRNGLLTSDPNVGIQTVVDYDNTNTYISFPAGAIDNEFSIDIALNPFTQAQKDAVEAQSDIIASTPNKNALYGYTFTIRDINDEIIDGQSVKLDAVLHLVYDTAAVATNSWNEADMAIFYWDDNGSTGQWVRVGGTVDTGDKTVVARAEYVHKFYALMPKAADSTADKIKNVTVRPKVFTPGRSQNAYYESVRLSFEFDQSYDSYQVYVFDLKGNMIRMFEKTGGYIQGEVAWDGNDSDGYAVNSGVYVYRVVIPGTDAQYSGTVIIAR